MKEKLQQERPGLGYFTSRRIHHTERPKPQLTPHKLPERIPDPPDFKTAPEPRIVVTTGPF